MQQTALHDRIDGVYTRYKVNDHLCMIFMQLFREGFSASIVGIAVIIAPP